MEQLYLPIKEFHSGLRWIILALAAIVVIKYLAGWVGKKRFTSLDNKLSLFYVSALDIQLLLGLVLYFFLSPVTLSAIQFGGYAIDDPNVRFYAMEHPVTMVLAIIIAHIGRVMVKRSKTDHAKFMRGTLMFGLSVIFMLSRMPW